jgi:predicted enzyme related to lactoylglutathione lyase
MQGREADRGRAYLGIYVTVRCAGTLLMRQQLPGMSGASSMNEHEKLNYVEFPARDLARTKAFFERAFGWSFIDYGPDYAAFAAQGLDGGFFRSGQCSTTANGAALLVFYSNDLEATLERVTRAGGVVLKSIYAFPGGRRFHFTEPSGNEFAVWSEPEAN